MFRLRPLHNRFPTYFSSKSKSSFLLLPIGRTIPNSLPYDTVWGHCEPIPAEEFLLLLRWSDFVLMCQEPLCGYGLSFLYSLISAFICFFSSSCNGIWTVSVIVRVRLYHWSPIQVSDVFAVNMNIFYTFL